MYSITLQDKYNQSPKFGRIAKNILRFCYLYVNKSLKKPVLVSAFFCNKDLDCNKEFNKYHDFGAVFVENIWFCTFLICDWFKIFSPLSQPMRIKTRALLAEIA